IIGLDTISLQGSIDVTGKGFRGGQPDESNYPLANCHINKDTTNLPASITGYAGYKGEGIVTTSWMYAKGPGHALNGGGGGEGLFAGGGGGINIKGAVGAGDGGQQASTCGNNITKIAKGGHDLSSYNKFYKTNTCQIIMGGGGGSGTENETSSRYATAGGNGGGIIMLITETFLGNNGVIRANGEDVTGIANASGGGGGGGGAILLDAALYSGTFSVEIQGGDGGNTNENCTGAGGGGGGGVLWYSGSSFPAIIIDTSAGNNGVAVSACPYQYGWPSIDGTRFSSLVLPLNGFLFNTIHGTDTICAGQTPNLLTGSNPKGGNGNYTFAWYKSTDSITWDSIANTRDYQPGVLYQTTFYQRIVRSEGIIDESRPIKVLVYNAISGNTLTGNDTLCYNATAKQITGTTSPVLTGGNNNFTYQWLYSADGNSWNNITGAVSVSYTPPGSQISTRQYRRHVTSAKVCSDTSNKVEITVLPSITSNSFVTEDTLICQNFSPGPLNAITPQNGDGSYSYKWLQKPASGNWTEISSSNIMQFNPGPLSETTRYRRIVFSGNDNACIDTSEYKSVNVLNAITNNLISIDSSHWCAGDSPDEITGQLPAGGESGSYSYQWQIRTSGDWSNITGATGIGLTPSMVEQNTDFRRIVASGELQITGRYACYDTSAALHLTVIPYIINTLNLDDQTLCQYNTPLPLNPSTSVTGGNNTFSYQWRFREEGSESWEDAPGVSDSPGYTPGALEKTTYFIRSVTSDICEQISDTLTVKVFPVITNNQIAGSPVQYTCFNTSIQLQGPGYEGGKEDDYTFLWEQSSDGTSWSDASGLTANTLADFESTALTDSIFFRRTIFSSAALKECTSTSDSILILIHPLPTGDLIASVDTICGGESLYIPFRVSGGQGPYTVTIGADDLNNVSKSEIMALTDSILLEFNNVERDYDVGVFSIRDANECYADASGFTNKHIVTVYAVPDADAGDGGRVCSNQFTLAAESPLPSHTGLWSVPGGTFTDPTSPSSLVTVDYYGNISMEWTVTNWHCSDSDTTVVIFDEQPSVIDAGDDQILDFLYSTQLDALPPTVGSGTWKVVEGTGIINDNTLYNTSITELASDNLIRWTIVNGVCPEIKDSVRITVNDLDIQKGFTPNGDFINDDFVIPTPNAERIEIKVFNRTGVLVFESDDYTQGKLWNGGFNNDDSRPCPEGTYYYWMKVWVRGSAEPREYKKFIEILR
ncbi:MAG: gliding motility-associated C-terminal domain-containing protein, partial [Bacteroidales bacterium]|nr:gliding motility-associated C-terminal domain-containing protein [Bacteroidales bacterium]